MQQYGILAVVSTFILSGCFEGPGFFSQKNPAATGTQLVKATNSGGTVSANISSSSSVSQQVQGSDALSGSSVTFPPGSLAVSTNIQVTEGQNMVDAAVVDLGLGDLNASSGSSTLAVSPDVAQDPAKPLTLSIPVSYTGLALNSKHIAVVYMVQVFAEGGQIKTGVLTSDQVSLANGKAVFSTPYWGAFQVIFVDRPVTEKKEVAASVTTIPTKKVTEAMNPLIWGEIAIKADAASRSADLTAQFDPGGDRVAKCVAEVAAQKGHPLISREEITEPKLTLKPKDGAEVKRFVSFSCRMNSGRYTRSQWSDQVTLPGIQVAISGQPSGSLEAGSQVSISLSGNFAKFKYAVTGDACDGANYSAPQSGTSFTTSSGLVGTIRLCVIGTDAAGIDSVPQQVSWQQTTTTGSGSNQEPTTLALTGWAAPDTSAESRYWQAGGDAQRTLTGTCDSGAGDVILDGDFNRDNNPAVNYPCNNDSFAIVIQYFSNTTSILSLDHGERGMSLELSQAGGQKTETVIFKARSGQIRTMIATPTEFLAIAPSDLSKFYILSSSIDFSGQGVKKPIGKPAGTCTALTTQFDGDGHSINNLTISDSTAAVGVFCRVNDGGSVSNVDFSNLSVSFTGGSGTAMLGSVAGEVAGGTNWAILSKVGVIDSTVNGASDNFVGGIVGKVSNGGVYGSSFSGTVIGGQYVGGAIGWLSRNGTSRSQAFGVSVVNGNSSTTVTGSNNSVGGLVGKNLGHIAYGYVQGIVTGGYIVGGLAGEMTDASGSPAPLIEWSASQADVIKDPSTQAFPYAGGLVGKLIAGDIYRSKASGSVSSTVESILGGFVGHVGANSGEISDCFATGSVTSSTTGGPTNDYVGGFVGRFEGGASSKIYRSYAAGAVNGPNIIGGFAGSVYNSVGPAQDSIQASFAFGTVGTATTAGSFVGSYDTDGTIKNVWWSMDGNCQGTGYSNCGSPAGQVTAATDLHATNHPVYQQPSHNWDFSQFWMAQPSGFPVLRMFQP